MKVLVVGSGGREHALSWKLSQSERVESVYTAPGNPGTAAVGVNVPREADDIEGLKDFAVKEGIDLTVVGPELPLTLGITDVFEAAGLKVFGPTKRAAELEGSKVFCKELMVNHGIPTARYKKFSDPDQARSYAETLETHDVPLVVKADGLAAGKGVLICPSMEEAFVAIDMLMKEKAFGKAGETIVIEDYLTGEEASLLAITDGECVVPLAPAQDHKPIYDGDKGPNTGGMGAYSPTPALTEEMQQEVMDSVMIPAVKAMAEEGRPYKGVLYAGLMISHGRHYVLEFNCRFGDPECQPLLMRLRSDLFELLLSAAEGTLDSTRLEWDERTALCVVMASEGYPGSYEKGRVIEGIERAAAHKDVEVFHAGTAEKDGKIVTAGGRVLGVTGLGSGIKEAIETTYKGVEEISFEGAYYRGDIGTKALNR